MRVIGLTGGVGSGKSLAAQMLQEACGAKLLIADDLGHVVMEPGTEGFIQIRNRFGGEVVKPDGTIDRAWLADRIFRDAQARQDLNAIIHPQVIRYIKNYIQERKQQPGIIILESAILFESGCDTLCDEIWYVHVSAQTRKKRLAEDRGYSEAKTQAIMQQQMADEAFYSRCDVIIENNGTKQELKKNIQDKINERKIQGTL